VLVMKSLEASGMVTSKLLQISVQDNKV